MQANSYRADIDGLRAIAVLSVLFHHLSERLAPGGYVGVDVFFVISGYLITRIISREHETGRFSWARFFERRLRRLTPAVVVTIAATLAGGYALLTPTIYASTLKSSLATVLFSSNLFFWRELQAGYFAADAKLNPLLHTWSLGVEEQFYLLYPVLLLVLVRLPRRWATGGLCMVAIASLGGAIHFLPGHEVAVFFLSPFRAWELVAGALLARGVLPEITSARGREIASLVGLAGILLPVALYTSQTRFPGLAALPPVLGTVLLLHAGGSGPSRIRSALQLRPLVFVGLISYSLYLVHWPLIVLTRFAVGLDEIEPWIPALLVASFALATLSYRFVEQPFRTNPAFTRRGVFGGAAAMSALVIAFALLGLRQNGFAHRFDARALAHDRAGAPTIPFVECDDRALRSPSEWCSLGDESVDASLLLWGDSHLLAWAPALDELLAAQQRRAIFLPNSACPPLLGVELAAKPGCTDRNARILQFLENSPELKQVVLVGYWRSYFEGKTRLTFAAPTTGDSREVAPAALTDTVERLSRGGVSTVLLGPVPVYDKSVPLALALQSKLGRDLLPMPLESHRMRHRRFYETVAALSPDRARVVDPAEWMCRPHCAVEHDGIALYRDAHHLSRDGALTYQSELARALSP